MRWIVRSSLKFRFLVVAAALAMMLFGVAQLRDTPVDVFPEFAPPKVEVQTAALGLTAEEVEQFVTVPLEEALTGVPDLDVIRSSSVSDLSDIVLQFDRGTDILDARQVVQERLDVVRPQLPNWTNPPFMIVPLSSTSRVMKIGLSSTAVSLREMSTLSYWRIKQRLKSVPGVADVTIWGERLQRTHILIDPQKLLKHGISRERLTRITGDALETSILQYSPGQTPGAGGFVDTPNQRLPVRHVLPITTPDKVARVTVKESQGKPVRLEDLATVTEGSQPLSGDAVINDRRGLMLIVTKYPWANTLDVTRGVDDAMDAMRPGLPGIEVDTTIFRPATFIETAIDNLTRALLIGCLLVIFVLIAFLFEWRAALISLIAIPLSLVAAGLVLHLREAAVNTMILAGLVIAVGVVVDDAIIDVENIVRRLRQNRLERLGRSTFSIVLEGSLEIRRAIVYATLINVVAVVPIFLLQGLSGAFFQPLVLSYGLAVLASLVVALTVTPALALIFFSKTPMERREPALARGLKRVYGALLSRVIRTPRPAFLLVGVAAVAGVLVVPQLGSELLPNFKERDFLMHWITKPGTSVKEEGRVSVAACRELRTIPGVRNCGSHIGQALNADEPVGVNFGENWISVDPKADYDKTLASISDTVDGYPGIQRDVQTYLRERVREVLTGASESIVVRVFGQDLAVMRQKAEEVEAAMSKVDGLVDLAVEAHDEIPQIDVTTRLADAQRYGVKPGDVRRMAGQAVASQEAGELFHSGAAFDVMLWSPPGSRDSLSDIRALAIDTPGGGQVRLEQVADIEIKPTPNVVEHENTGRRIDVLANISGRDLGSVVKDVESAIKEVKFPLETHAELVGESQERSGVAKRIRSFGLLTAIAIFLLLSVSFGSVRLATIFFLTLPMALVGGALAVYAGNGIISLGSMVGFFTVFGIAARNGILMINHFQHLEREEGEPFSQGLVLRGAKERLTPILMTALATGLALVPLAVAGSLPGHEIEHPMAIVILGGLVTSTLVNLFVVPALYLRFAKGWNFRAGGSPPQPSS
jgi:CzcA family heavy metal efflux pump